MPSFAANLPTKDPDCSVRVEHPTQGYQIISCEQYNLNPTNYTLAPGETAPPPPVTQSTGVSLGTVTVDNTGLENQLNAQTQVLNQISAKLTGSAKSATVRTETTNGSIIAGLIHGSIRCISGTCTVEGNPLAVGDWIDFPPLANNSPYSEIDYTITGGEVYILEVR